MSGQILPAGVSAGAQQLVGYPPVNPAASAQSYFGGGGMEQALMQTVVQQQSMMAQVIGVMTEMVGMMSAMLGSVMKGAGGASWSDVANNGLSILGGLLTGGSSSQRAPQADSSGGFVSDLLSGVGSLFGSSDSSGGGIFSSIASGVGSLFGF